MVDVWWNPILVMRSSRMGMGLCDVLGMRQTALLCGLSTYMAMLCGGEGLNK